jgi:hypothetical protein
MAQTRRRRRSKHRGTPAGTIEARGRTGRKPRTEEKRRSGPARSETRFDRPPTWRGAVNRALVAAGIFFVAVLLLFKQPLPAAISLSLFTLAIYIPMGYYTDLFLYRRRMRRKAEQ